MPTLRQALAGLTCALVATLAPYAHAQTEAQGTLLAQALNLRYGKTAPYCSPGAAYYCDGVLVRSIPENAGDATDPTPDEAARNVVTLAYLRADAKVTKLASNAGFVVPDFNDAQAHGQPYQPYCVYAFAPSLADRNDHGCGMPGAAPAGQSDPSSCNALGIVNDQQWLAYYLDHGSDLSRQCSFSVLASQFAAALAVRQLPQVAAHLAAPDTVLIRGWSLGYSASLPVEAFYYVDGNPDGRAAAMQYRKAYYAATARKVPVLHMDLSKAASVFAYDLADNPDHDFGHPIDENIANELNARFKDARDRCPDGSASLNCSGVILRMAKPGGGYEIWDNSPTAHQLGSVSFFFLRSDASDTVLPWNGAYGTVSGYLIHTPEESLQSGKPLDYECIFPLDAGTQYNIPDRKSAGCAPLLSPPAGKDWPKVGQDADLASCPVEGIVTAQQWLANLQQVVYGNKACSFSVIDADAFNTALAAQRLWNKHSWNELLIAIWPDHSPDKVPIQAFFYNSSQNGGLQQAQADQVDFCRDTGILVPIVQLDTAAQDGNVFSYRRSDQLDCV
jgi:hypothetical protein